MRLLVLVLLMISSFSLSAQAQECSPVEIQRIGNIVDHKQPIHLVFNETNHFKSTQPNNYIIEDDDGFLRLYLVWAVLAQGGFDSIEVKSVKKSLELLVGMLVNRLEASYFELEKQSRMSEKSILAFQFAEQKMKEAQNLLAHVVRTQMRDQHEQMALIADLGRYVNTYKKNHVYKVPHHVLGFASFYSFSQPVDYIFSNTEFTDKPLLLSDVEHIPCVKAVNEQVAYSLLDDLLSTDTIFAEAQ